MADRTLIRLRRSRAISKEQLYLLSHASGVEIDLGDLPDDRLTKREERAAGPDRSLRIKPPDWFTDMLKRGASPKEVLGALRDRFTEMKDLRDVQSIINEVGRLPSGGRLLRSMLTQDIVNRVQRERRHG